MKILLQKSKRMHTQFENNFGRNSLLELFERYFFFRSNMFVLRFEAHVLYEFLYDDSSEVENT